MTVLKKTLSNAAIPRNTLQPELISGVFASLNTSLAHFLFHNLPAQVILGNTTSM